MRKRRWASRACLGAAALVAAVAAVTPAGAQEAPDPEANRPEVWGGEAGARAIGVLVDRRQGILPIPNVLSFGFLEGNSAFDVSGESSARAAFLYPGNGVMTGPGLVCGTFGRGAPPELAPLLALCTQVRYPLAAQADANNPDAATDTAISFGRPGGQISANGGAARAHAARDYVSTDAVVQDLLLPAPEGALPQPGPVLEVDAAVARTSERFEGRTFIVRAEARLSGTRLLGIVDIDSIVASSVSRTGDVPKPVTDAKVTISGVTVVGQQAEITPDGIVVPGSAAANPLVAVARAAVESLRSSGVDIRLLGATSEAAAIETSGQARGVTVRIERDLSEQQGIGDVYFASLLLGSAGTSGYADDVGATDDDAGVAPIDDFLAPGDGGVPVDGGLGDDGTGGLDTDLSGPAVPADDPPATRDPGDAVAAPPLRPSAAGGPLGGLAATRLKWLYLAFTLTALGCCLAPRLVLPARLPRRP